MKQIEIDKYDKDKMIDVIKNLYSHIEHSFEIISNSSLEKRNNIKNILICGMGGSAIGGDFVKTVLKDELKVPITVNRDYDLPSWVTNKTLVLICSYSGNTEETISCYNSTISNKIKPIIISSGGYILNDAKNNNFDYVQLPPGIQPRAAFGYSASLLLLTFVKIGLINKIYSKQLFDSIDSIKSNSLRHASLSKDNDCLNLANAIYNKFPIIYCTVNTEVVGFRFRCQLAENSKILSSHFILPEQNHNEIEGFSNNDTSNYAIIWIKDENDNKHTLKRFDITSTLLDKVENQYVFSDKSNSLIERLFNLIYLFDWVSFYCAIYHQTNPTPVNTILKLKSLMSK
mgnify:CR=1 FL=1